MLLLRDLRAVFREHDRDKLPTGDIIAALLRMDESPWAVIRRGKPLDARGLSQRLRKYGIGPEPQRVGADVFKGYCRSQFLDAWSRYLTDQAPHRDSAVTSVTDETSQVSDRADLFADGRGCNR